MRPEIAELVRMLAATAVEQFLAEHADNKIDEAEAKKEPPPNSAAPGTLDRREGAA